MARKARNVPVPRNLIEKNGELEQIRENKVKSFRAALYIRLSKEDSGKSNQNTVENQQALLEDYVSDKADISIYDIYIDNGFSGTNFARPAFQKMMEDMKAGKVNCIIVKDLSRFGRSYLEIGNYIEKIFPFFHVRFISVTDHFDTYVGENLESGMTIPLKNIINEVYAKDISQKVGSAIDLKKQEGRYGGGVAPYGYRKSEIEKGKYVVDEEVASVVQYIFELRSKGLGYCTIVKNLNEKGIKSPSAYRFEKGIVKNERMKNVIWKIYAIEDMLRDEVYLGHMVRGKTRSALYKGEKRHHVPREEWIVVKNMHEPIISQELYDAVQIINDEKKSIHQEHLQKTQKARKKNLFIGKIFCGDCGITMGVARKGNYLDYYCPNYKENGNAGCRKKHMSALKVEKAVLETVKAHVSIFEYCIDRIHTVNSGQENVDYRRKLQAESKNIKKEETNYRKKISELYLDYKNELLSVSEYFQIKGQYEKKISECVKLYELKSKEIFALSEEYGESLELYQNLSIIQSWDILTEEIINCLIESVKVYPDNQIEVVFRYLDQFEEVVKKYMVLSAGMAGVL